MQNLPIWQGPHRSLDRHMACYDRSMVKRRFSISVDEEHAAQIREAAARAGQDVSTYMWRAALEAVDRDARVAEIFADVDERIAAAEGAAAAAGEAPLLAPADGELTDAEQAAVATRWKAFFEGPAHGAA
jgi:hypothetical protein